MVCAAMKEMFADTRFDFINAGISSTCSTTGAFRLAEHVLSSGSVDLLFVEFAVNDGGAPPERIWQPQPPAGVPAWVCIVREGS